MSTRGFEFLGLLGDGLVRPNRPLLRTPFDTSLRGTRIVRTPETCGNSARVIGTRTPVWLLVVNRRLGLTDPQLLESYPGLSQEDLDAVWEYERLRCDEIAQDIAEQESKE